MNLPAPPRSLSRSANFGLLRIDRGLDRMADGRRAERSSDYAEAGKGLRKRRNPIRRTETALTTKAALVHSMLSPCKF